RRVSVAAGRDAPGLDDGDATARSPFVGGAGLAAALRSLRGLDPCRTVAGLRLSGDFLAAHREDLDPFGQLEHRREGVFPGEVQVIATAVSGVAVVADPAEGCPRAVLDRLGPVGEAGDAGPAAVAPAAAVQGHDVDRESVVM